MTLSLSFSKQEFWQSEDAPVAVRLGNETGAATDLPALAAQVNWQPRYTLSGPSFPGGVTRSLASARPDAPPAPPGPEIVAREPVDPGEAATARIGLASLFGWLEPGDYTLSATLEWEGTRTEAAPVRFRVLAERVLQAALAVADGNQASFPIPVAVLAEVDGRPALGLALFAETGAHLNTVAFTGSAPATRLEAAPRQLIGAAQNSRDIGSPGPRVGYLGDGRVGFWDPRRRELRTLDVPAAARIVRPALVAANGAIAVFMIDEAARSVTLLQFPQGGAPAPAWSHTLAVAPAAARATIGRDDGCAAAALARGAGGVDVILVEAAGTRTAHLKDAAPLGNSEPALCRHADGSVSVAALLSDGDRRSVVLATARFPSGTGNGVVDARRFALPGEAASGAVAWSSAPGTRRLEWCAVLADGGIVTPRTLDHAQYPAARLASPPELLAMSEQLFLVGLAASGRVELAKIV